MTTIIESRPAGNDTAVAGAATAALTTRQAQFVLTLSCPEQPGIVRAVTAFLADRGFDIVEHQQFDDHVSGNLFLRTAFTGGAPTGTVEPDTGKSSPRRLRPPPSSSTWPSPSTTAGRSGCW